MLAQTPNATIETVLQPTAHPSSHVTQTENTVNTVPVVPRKRLMTRDLIYVWRTGFATSRINITVGWCTWTHVQIKNGTAPSVQVSAIQLTVRQFVILYGRFMF